MAKESPELQLLRKPNHELIPLLGLEPIVHAHSLFVCLRLPEASSWVAAQGGAIEGMLISGGRAVPQVQGYWLSAANPKAAQRLLEILPEASGFSLSFPLWATSLVQKRFPRSTPEIDQLVHFPGPSMEAADADVRLLTRQVHDALENRERFRGQIHPSDLYEGAPFFGLVRAGQLLSLGEHGIETETVCVLSQMYTLEEHRGQGHAEAVAKALTRSVLARGKLPVAFFSETNTASRRVFEKVGYTLSCRTGFVEVRPST